MLVHGTNSIDEPLDFGMAGELSQDSNGAKCDFHCTFIRSMNGIPFGS
jgi:hypothetical protein